MVLDCEDLHCMHKYIIIRIELVEYLFSIADYILTISLRSMQTFQLNLLPHKRNFKISGKEISR